MKKGLAYLAVGLGLLALWCLVWGALDYYRHHSGEAEDQWLRAHWEARAVINGGNEYRSDVGAYPRRLQDLLTDPGVKGWRGPYLSARLWDKEGDYPSDLTLDPWGNKWIFTPTSAGFTIESYGADGAPGGVGPDRDMVLSQP